MIPIPFALIEGTREGFNITEPGFKALGGYDPLPTGDALIQYWEHRLSGKKSLIVTQLRLHPRGMSGAELAAAIDMSDRSGTWDTYISELRRLGLISGGRDKFTLSKELTE